MTFPRAVSRHRSCYLAGVSRLAQSCAHARRCGPPRRRVGPLSTLRAIGNAVRTGSRRRTMDTRFRAPAWAIRTLAAGASGAALAAGISAAQAADVTYQRLVDPE